MVTWIIPEAATPSTASEVPGPGRSAGKSGLRLGVLDNSKSNADHLLGMIVEGMKAALPITSVLSLRKSSPAIGAPSDMLDELAREADVVISAMAD